jgi:methionyl-tRNA formyltransferase
MKIKIIFLGTPEFACPTLEVLFDHPDNYEVVGVITQPDRPAGRNLETQPSRIKQLAQNHNVSKGRVAKKVQIWEPETMNDALMLKQIEDLHVDLAVIVAYGKILPQGFLNLFKMGAVNVHASLLPRWRGAAPIAWALLSEDPTTGVTLQKVVAKLDAGDIIATAQVDLDSSWDAPKLYTELSRKGADVVRRYLPDYIEGKIKLIPQDEKLVSLAPKIKKEHGLVNWSWSANEICARIRALTPWPGVWTTRDGKILKILRAQARENVSSSPPGSLVGQDAFGFAVQCGGATALLITVVQPESRARQPVSEYLKGYPFTKGDCLGN